MERRDPQRPLLQARDGDYLLEHGQRVTDPSYLSEVLFSLTHHRGSSPIFPTWLGSRFHELQKITDDFARGGSVLRQVELMADEAVAWLTTPQRITAWSRTASVQGAGRVNLRVSWRERDGTIFTRNLSLSVGT